MSYKTNLIIWKVPMPTGSKEERERRYKNYFDSFEMFCEKFLEEIFKEEDKEKILEKKINEINEFLDKIFKLREKLNLIPWALGKKKKFTIKWRIFEEIKSLERFFKRVKSLMWYAFIYIYFNPNTLNKVDEIIYNLGGGESFLLGIDEDFLKSYEQDKNLFIKVFNKLYNIEEEIDALIKEKVKTPKKTKKTKRKKTSPKKDFNTNPTREFVSLSKNEKKLGKIRNRLENLLSLVAKPKEWELEKIKAEIEKLKTEKTEELCNNLFKLIDKIKAKEEREDTVEKVKNGIPKVLKPRSTLHRENPEEFNRYVFFLDELLNRVNKNFSNKKNRNFNSRNDWTFIAKVFRPFIRNLKYFVERWEINLKNTSWKEITELYNKYIDNKNPNELIFLNILKDYKEKWNIINIFPSFIKSIESFPDIWAFSQKKFLFKLTSELKSVYEEMKI